MMEYPQKAIVEAWLSVIKKSLEKRDNTWGKYAKEISKFYDGPPDWMWNEEKAYRKADSLLASGTSLPNFRIQVNKPFEAVALYGPSLFHRYPHVLVEPVQRPQIAPEAHGLDMRDPYAVQAYQGQQMVNEMDMRVRSSLASIAGSYLNTVQRITNKKQAARVGITDAIVKGVGLGYTKVFQPKGTDIRYPRSEHLDPFDFVKDGDASYDDDVQFQAVRSYVPRNELAEQWGIPDKFIRGRFQSFAAQTMPHSKKQAAAKKTPKNEQDSTFDIVEVWEVYSKNGFGHDLKRFDDKSRKLIGNYDMFGPFCYLVLVEGVPFPLNLPPWVLEEESSEEIFDRVQWPIPFWTPPLCGWPVSELGFYFKSGSVWPLPMFKPLMGPIRFVNWCMSFLADKSAAACTDYMAVVKKAAETIKQQLEEGVGPYKMLELPDVIGQDINKIVTILQAPNFHEGVWRMVVETMQLIDRESGVNELLAGMAGGIRSATEADYKQANTQIRPDDMNQKTEDWTTEMAKKEILAAQWVLDQDEIASVVGDEAASVWMNHMATQEFQSVVGDFDYKIEAGSARKPNVANKVRALNEYWQSGGQIAAQMVAQGNPSMWNAYHQVWGEVNQIDPTPFLLPMPAPEEQQPDAEDIKSEREMRNLEFDEMKHEQELRQNEQAFQQEYDFDEQRGRLELSQQRSRNRLAGSNGR